LAGRWQRPGRADHLRRAVHADDFRVRPAGGQRRGQLAGPAAKVSHQPGIGGSDSCQQLEERPGALAGEPLILIGIPHASSIFLDVKISSSGSTSLNS
jgi:hypothetical protein